MGYIQFILLFEIILISFFSFIFITIHLLFHLLILQNFLYFKINIFLKSLEEIKFIIKNFLIHVSILKFHLFFQIIKILNLNLLILYCFYD